MNIDIDVRGQRLTLLTDIYTFVEGTQNFITFTFNLDEQWGDLNIFAQFAQNGKAYNVYLNSQNKVCLPSEIKAGTCILVLYGTAGESVIGTTNFLVLKFDKNMLIANADSTEITQPLYNQLIQKFKNELENSKSLYIPYTVFSIPANPTYEELIEGFGSEENFEKFLESNDPDNLTPIYIESEDGNFFPVIDRYIDPSGYFILSFYNGSADLVGASFYVPPHSIGYIDFDGYDFKISGNSVAGLISVGRYSGLPKNRVESGRIAYVTAAETKQYSYEEIPIRTPVYVKPKAFPNLDATGGNQPLTIVNGSDRAIFRHLIITHYNEMTDNTETSRALEYKLIFSNGPTIKYAFAETAIDGYLSAGWNIYNSEAGRYYSNNYDNMSFLTGVIFNSLDSLLAGLAVTANVLFYKDYPSGYYSFDSALSRWDYGLVGNPTTQAIRFPVTDIRYDYEGRRSALDDNGVYYIPPYLDALYIGATKYGGGADLQTVYIPDNIFNNLYQKTKIVSTTWHQDTDPEDDENDDWYECVIELERDVTIYNHYVSTGSLHSFSIDASSVNAENVLTFELIICMAVAKPVEFTGITWLNGETPNIEDDHYFYDLAFRKIGNQWIGNLQGRWAFAIPGEEGEEEETEE